MNRALKIFLMLIAAILLVAVGALLSSAYQGQQKPAETAVIQPATQPATPLNQTDQQELNKLRLLKSSVVSSLVLFGQVTNISGNVITLSSGKDNSFFTADPKAKYYIDITSKSGAGQTTPAQFSDIKVGDNLQARTVLLADDRLNAFFVLIVK